LQWQKAYRGGEHIGAIANEDPFRLTPWTKPTSTHPANIDYGDGSSSLAPVASFVDDKSPDGVFDMAGNVSEWTSSMASGASYQGLRRVMGSNWGEPESLGHLSIRWRNARPDGFLDYGIGIRCITNN
jgi:formylglycine-generating enzyme required for sulfatase activity